MPRSVQARYDRLIAAGEIERDPAQDVIVAKLAALERALAEHRLARKSSSLGWLFATRERQPVKGLYLYGDVGRGKTMLMDLFYEASPIARKRRTHFHGFMADVHERIADFRRRQKDGEQGGDDAIARTADAIAQESWLICFDEFHVTDIADAMILGRLFTRLFAAGVVVVATSNVAPRDLYKDGLNRALFLPFIDLIERHMAVAHLDARTDFRLEKLGGAPVWHVPADARADAALDQAWRRLAGGHEGAPHELVVKNRVVPVPRAALGAARFSFDDLCERPLGAGDYLKIAHEFHTVVLDHIPVLGDERRNATKRLIILIDMLYDNAVKLVASAEAEADALYRGDSGFEAQEFRRTASRLIEMRSQSYLALPHGRQAATSA